MKVHELIEALQALPEEQRSLPVCVRLREDPYFHETFNEAVVASVSMDGEEACFLLDRE